MSTRQRIKAVERKAGGGVGVTAVFLGDDHRITDKAQIFGSPGTPCTAILRPDDESSEDFRARIREAWQPTLTVNVLERKD